MCKTQICEQLELNKGHLKNKKKSKERCKLYNDNENAVFTHHELKYNYTVHYRKIKGYLLLYL